jgi:hypothetical protein
VEIVTQSRQFRPHLEASQPPGFEETPVTTTVGRNVASTTTVSSPPDIGSVIQSFLTTALTVVAPVPSVHGEKTEDGWAEATPNPTILSSFAVGPHWEISTDGFGHPTGQGAPGPQVTSAGPKVTLPALVPIPIVTPPPMITQGGLTLQPVPVTSVRVTTVDGKPTTLEATINYRYVVGSATIPLGTPTTINNVIVAMTVDGSGSTVLVAGDQTTTLAPSARGSQATDSPQAIAISTTVVGGTTNYILAGQTLAPGQAITVGNVPISMGTRGGSTVLVMGDVTTTFAAGPIASDGSAPAAGTLGVTGGVGRGGGDATTTSARSNAPSVRTTNWVLSGILAIAALVRPLV